MDDELRREVRQIITGEFKQFLRDIEFRVAQAYEVSRRAAGTSRVFAEDLAFGLALTGYTVTNNTPSAGYIEWSSLHVVYNGADNAITDGNTNLTYVWWDPAVSATALQTSNTKPVLSSAAALIFVNNGGTATVAVGATMPPAIGDKSVDASAIIAGAVGAGALASAAVTSGAIASGAVGASALAPSAVTSGAIASGAVGASALAAGASLGNIGAAGLTAAYLAAGASLSNIGAGGVTGTYLAAGAVAPVNLNTLQHILY